MCANMPSNAADTANAHRANMPEGHHLQEVVRFLTQAHFALTRHILVTQQASYTKTLGISMVGSYLC